jgi:hypothetical protein
MTREEEMNRTLAKCPVCGDSLHVTELACDSCETRIHGVFGACRFCSLPPDQEQFLELFLRNRGNLTGVGAELGVSHPTVAKRLDAVLAALDLAAEDSRSLLREDERARIIEMLDRGEISAEDATRRLREL